MVRGIVPVALFAVLTGCTADGGDGGILVLKNVRAAAECTVTADESETGVSHGSLELVQPTGYLFIAQMRSRVTALTGQEDQRTIIVSGANVDITFPNSDFFDATELADLNKQGLTHFKALFTAPLAPNSGIADVGFTLIPQTLVERIKAKVDITKSFRLETVATFTVVGDMSGEKVESQEFSFPVTIGNYLVANVLGACNLPSGTTVSSGYSCNPYQDGVADCCSRPNGTLVCPGIVSTSLAPALAPQSRL